MKKTRWLTMLSCGLIGLSLALGLSSCVEEPAAYRPQAWIDYPSGETPIQLGTEVVVISHGFAPEGVAEVVLSVNGEPYRRDAPPEEGADFVSLQQVWIPAEAGLYTLQVQVYDMRGQAGYPATVNVEVREDAGGVTPVISATPPPTALPPTSPPQDTTPPPAPSPAVPANGLELTCRAAQTLAWLPVDDPSSIAGYYVKMEMEVQQGQWQSAGGYGPVTGKQVEVNVQCGVRYRWMVRAQDGAGNFSNWSAPSYFSITLN